VSHLFDADELFDESVPAGGRPRGTVEVTAHIRGDGMRLDQFLTQQFAEFSRSEFQTAIKDGVVTVNGQSSKASYKVRDLDHIIITLPEPVHGLPQPEDIPIEVLYEDQYLALVNKPPGMVVHPAKGNWTGTLVNAIQFRFGDLSQANGSHRPGVVHRLDRDTSGVILIAKEEGTHRELGLLFEHRKIFKEYLAITFGTLDRDSDYVEVPLRMHPHDRVKMAVARPDDPLGKPCCSYYEVIERFHGYTYVRVQPRTGRTHQIRVHLTHVGTPILADKLYWGRDRLLLSDVAPAVPPERDELLLLRQALHAYRLRFQHPRTGVWLEVCAPLPPEFERTLTALRTHRGARRSL
jgi:23S rRNA pseudouridine1911/1915/1917 synthase